MPSRRLRSVRCATARAPRPSRASVRAPRSACLTGDRPEELMISTNCFQFFEQQSFGILFRHVFDLLCDSVCARHGLSVQARVLAPPSTSRMQIRSESASIVGWSNTSVAGSGDFQLRASWRAGCAVPRPSANRDPRSMSRRRESRSAGRPRRSTFAISVRDQIQREFPAFPIPRRRRRVSASHGDSWFWRGRRRGLSPATMPRNAVRPAFQALARRSHAARAPLPGDRLPAAPRTYVRIPPAPAPSPNRCGDQRDDRCANRLRTTASLRSTRS